ncbi:MAG: hypothetical protein ACLFTK_10805 [Anaerolineales bacterium]
MAATYFFTFLAAFILALPFALYSLRQRLRSGAGPIVKEDYTLAEDGDLITDHARFVAGERLLKLRQPGTTHTIPFDAIAGVFMQVRTSRKIHMGVILHADKDGPRAYGAPAADAAQGWLPLSTVTNNDLRQAGINGYRLTSVVAGEAEAEHFLNVFRAHQWSSNLLGASFEYRFGDHTP